MKAKESIDFLTYRSWWYQIHWYGMSKENARKLFNDWKAYEEKEQKERLGEIAVSPNQGDLSCLDTNSLKKEKINHKT